MAPCSKNSMVHVGILAVLVTVAGVVTVACARRRQRQKGGEGKNGANADTASTRDNGISSTMATTAASPAQVVFVLGGPGSGKGTQCALLAEDASLGFAHLSAGDLLRAERNSGSELAEMINEYIREGKIVPAEVTVGLLRKAMENSGKSKFLIDGFPRNPENLAAWEAAAADGTVVFEFALFLDCPEEVMTKRILARGLSSGRIDDNEEAIRKRLVTYRESTMTIINEFKARGKLREINSDQSIEDVAADVRKAIMSIA